MRLSLFIVTRSLLDKREKTFLSFISFASILGIAVGVAILIIALTILNGFEKAIEKHLIDMNAHITVSGFSGRNLEVSLDDLNLLKKKNKAIVSVSPYLSKNSIIKNGAYSEGIRLEGIDPGMDNSKLRNYIIRGEYDLSPKKETAALLVGEKLAEKMFLSPGDKVTLFTLRNDRPPSFDNPPIIERFLIKGIYRSGMAEFDDLKAYTNLRTMQNLTELNDLISGFYIKVDSIKNIRPLTKKLSAEFGFPFYVRSFYKTHQHIFTWLDLQKKPVPLILGLIILVAAFNIIGTMLMNVIQQTKKIGVLRVLGLRAKGIRSIFILQGMVLALTGIILGNVFALTLGWIQTEFNIVTLPASIYFISEVPIYFDFSIYLLVSFVALVVSLLVALIPSRIASRISPLSAVRFE